MTRILFVGDAAATGFGTVTTDLGKAFLDNGEDVRFLSMNVEGGIIPEPWGSRTYAVEPGARPEAILAVLEGTTPDGWVPESILMVSDFYSTDWILGTERITSVFRRVPSFHYCPIEGVGIPRAWRLLWEVLRPVAMTEFGRTEMRRVLGKDVPMVYHGVDQEMFYPIAPNRPGVVGEKRVGSQRAAKEHFGLDPNRTMILRTDRNVPRKRYASLLRSLYPVFERNPEVDLVIHCALWDQGGRLDQMTLDYPEWYPKRIYFTLAHNTFQGFSREELNLLYNAADIYCSVSAEGFGLTIAEAIACGVPAVGLNYSAVPEVIGPAGVTVSYTHLLDNEYGHFWAAIDEPAYGQAVERLIRKPALRRSLGSAGPRHVAANFSWRQAASQFSALISAALMEQAA